MKLGPALSLASLVLPVLAGCGATEEQLHTRAAFDMSCPEGSLHVVEIDSKTRGVEGCGQRATYVEACDGPSNSMRTCTWVRNGGSAQKD